ncbi:MAG: hypothetical protein ACLP6G_05620 [Terriglobales bacterium]
MNEKQSLISTGTGVAKRNLRYIVWFYLLNLLFAWFGASGFGARAHRIMDHSLYSDKLLHGFDGPVLIEMINRPEFGPMQSSAAPAMLFAFLFLLVSLAFMPGVLLGYSSDHRISRDEFFRACGRNLWRFVRLFVLAAIVVGVTVGLLSAGLGALAKAADKTNYERLPFFTALAGWIIILLVLTKLRIWFDLAQTDVVLRDQPAVRKSVAFGLRALRKNRFRLLGTYVAISLVALAVLTAGILLWHWIVPPSSVVGAFLVSQLTLLLLLATRFWQRASAVAFYVKQMTEPAVEMAPVQAVVGPTVALSQ